MFCFFLFFLSYLSDRVAENIYESFASWNAGDTRTQELHLQSLQDLFVSRDANFIDQSKAKYDDYV